MHAGRGRRQNNAADQDKLLFAVTESTAMSLDPDSNVGSGRHIYAYHMHTNWATQLQGYEQGMNAPKQMLPGQCSD